MISYTINIDNNTYPVDIIDRDVKIVWELDENGVIFRKRLDGTFTILKTKRAVIFERILAFTYCDKATITLSDDTGEMCSGTFRKKNLTVNLDKCQVQVKLDRDDEYVCLDKIADKEFNILAKYDKSPMPVYKVRYKTNRMLEFVIGEGDVQDLPVYYIGDWVTDPSYEDLLTPPANSFFPDGMVDQGSWTLFSNEYYWISLGSNPNTNNFHIKSIWVREVKTVIRIGEQQTETPSNTGTECDYYEWQFANSRTINDIVYDKFARNIESAGFYTERSDNSYLKIVNSLTCEPAEYKFTRGRKLNDIITCMIYDCFPEGFESYFFKSVMNPISGINLSNIILSQKSDCIFEQVNPGDDYTEKGDPATKGIITFKKLMEALRAMFNVYWAIDSQGNFRIEHKFYWDNNEKYDIDDKIGLDITTYYPMALGGENEYTFEDNMPIREKFTFMESWNMDFTGLPISYADCIDSTEEKEYSADVITTDIDPNYLFTEASKEGFCMFHCDSEIDGDAYNVFTDIGVLSQYEQSNAHFGFANLQDNYWRYDRYFPKGRMNNQETDFIVRPLKYQKSFSIPMCFNEFNPNELVKTWLGTGNVRTATYNVKTGFLTLELKYRDDI